MPMPSHEFFPLGDIGHLRDDAESEMLISPIKKSVSHGEQGDVSQQTPAGDNKPKVLHNYGMPEACKKYSDVSQQRLHPSLDEYFRGLGLKVRDLKAPSHQGALRLDAGASLWPTEGHACVMLPVFHQPLDVVLEVRDRAFEGNVLHYVENWVPNMALHLHDKGLIVKGGSIRFVHLLYEVE
ncbi:hypothetical protein TOPH_07251 [Tolypocladium ophioglossoides CBS 100239]|uniref:Uncharacterized protein n=1 Tax=Tolypocladium ophioglossoides (strain CBS 100239) TaxID=1163406 RepID=A0A0L0N1W1_TOLOC|nr:hypothetical protein TOPH_07251 [Tolypocladium ophioglossoides CBS 100239]